jgi:hypothetical protein
VSGFRPKSVMPPNARPKGSLERANRPKAARFSPARGHDPATKNAFNQNR